MILFTLPVCYPGSMRFVCPITFQTAVKNVDISFTQKF